MATYTVNSKDPEYEGEVTLTLEVFDSGGENWAQLMHMDVNQGLTVSKTMDVNLEDIARLGRVAQALLDGRDASPRNFDHRSV